MSQLYPQGKAHTLGKATQIDVLTDTLIFLLYAGTYVDTHEFISDLTGASIVARSGALSGKTVSVVSASAVVDANDVTLAAVSGAAFPHVLLAKDTGVDASSPLLVCFDINPYTPDGNDITVVVNPSGLYAI